MSGFLRFVMAAATMSLASCGGGSGGETDYVLNQSSGGTWTGTDQVTNLPILGLVDELGHFHLIRGDGVQFVGTAVTAANAMSASIQGVTELGKTFPDGSTHGTGTLTADVTTGQSIDIDAQFTTDKGTAAHILTSLTFDNTYDESSSLAIIAANYVDTLTGTVFSIDSNGDIFAQDANTGCVINGSASIIEAIYNSYHLQVSYANCQGTVAALNGMTFTGLATLGDTASPQELIAGVTGTASDGSSAKYSIVYALKRESPGPP